MTSFLISQSLLSVETIAFEHVRAFDEVRQLFLHDGEKINETKASQKEVTFLMVVEP